MSVFYHVLFIVLMFIWSKDIVLSYSFDQAMTFYILVKNNPFRGGNQYF